MNLIIWDDYRKINLELMAIYFGKENTIWRVEACDIGADPISDGWYTFRGEELKYLAIKGDLNFNSHLIKD